MKKYLCDDRNAKIEIVANTADEAAQEFVDGGDWGDDKKTKWVTVKVTPLDDDDELLEDESSSITISIDPAEPDCEGGEDHDWQSPYEVLGGLRENPGVQGHGGGVVITEVCSRCGKYRITDTWAQNPSNGEQGLESVEYRDADDESLEWVESLKESSE